MAILKDTTHCSTCHPQAFLTTISVSNGTGRIRNKSGDFFCFRAQKSPPGMKPAGRKTIHWLMLYYMVFMHHGMTKGISSKTQFGVSASIKHFHRLWKKLSRHLSSPWYFTGLAISAQFPLKHSTCSFFSCVSIRSQENAESPPQTPVFLKSSVCFSLDRGHESSVLNPREFPANMWVSDISRQRNLKNR